MDLDLTRVDLSDPKNELQYQAYKCSLILQKLAIDIAPIIKKVVDDFLESASPIIRKLANEARNYDYINSAEYAIAAALYPRNAFLAKHAKKYRARKKNIKRLHQIGIDILNKGV